MYVQGTKSCIESFKAGQLVIFDEFLAKYGPVSEACEKWQLANVANHFQDDHRATGDALQQLMAAKANCGASLKTLATLCAHSSGSKHLAEVILEGKASYKEASQLIQKCDSVAGIVLLAGILMQDNPTKENLKATVEMASTTFGMSKDKIPAKMQKLLGELSKAKGLEEEPAKKDDGSKARKKRGAEPAADTDDRKGKKQKSKEEGKTKAEKPEKPEKPEKKRKDKDRKEKGMEKQERKQRKAKKEKQQKNDDDDDIAAVFSESSDLM